MRRFAGIFTLLAFLSLLFGIGLLAGLWAIDVHKVSYNSHPRDNAATSQAGQSRETSVGVGSSAHSISAHVSATPVADRISDEEAKDLAYRAASDEQQALRRRSVLASLRRLRPSSRTWRVLTTANGTPSAHYSLTSRSSGPPLASITTAYRRNSSIRVSTCSTPAGVLLLRVKLSPPGHRATTSSRAIDTSTPTNTSPCAIATPPSRTPSRSLRTIRPLAGRASRSG